MQNYTYKAYYVEESGEKFSASVAELNTDALPENEVLVRVHYSSLNYKDALSATGNKGVTRRYPHTPGIDAAGVVEESSVSAWKKGDEVIITSYDLGMNTPGGFGQYIRVPASWIVKLPQGLSLKESMMIGTAGFTAAMSADKLQFMGVTPDKGPILVTGASGGVGSLSLDLLHKLGYEVHVVTGKPEQKDFFTHLGAGDIISREEILKDAKRPILKPRWAGAVDTVGGDILATVLKMILPTGAVASCGNAASFELHTTVFPFILRGVSLVGIDSAEFESRARAALWQKLGQDWKFDHLQELIEEVTLDGLGDKIGAILQGKLKGRVLVNLS